jgi:hypothetical protein
MKMKILNIKRLLIKAVDCMEIPLLVIIWTAILYSSYKNPQVGIEILTTSIFIICLAVSIALPAFKNKKG